MTDCASGADLITATGDYVNDDGLPNSWSLKFIDSPDAGAVLLVDIDPWGKVTQTRQVTGDGVISFVDHYTRQIPYAIIDSDTAVGLGKAALAPQVRSRQDERPEPLSALQQARRQRSVLDLRALLRVDRRIRRPQPPGA
jgi:hypothetical protein